MRLTPGEIDAMRATGAVVADALAAVRAEAAVGMRLDDLDQVARAVLSSAGATSPFLGYRHGFAATPYPGVCLSVNDAVLHGIPTSYQLRDGDLLGVDCGATLDGWTLRSADGSRGAHFERTIAVANADFHATGSGQGGQLIS